MIALVLLDELRTLSTSTQRSDVHTFEEFYSDSMAGPSSEGIKGVAGAQTA